MPSRCVALTSAGCLLLACSAPPRTPDAKPPVAPRPSARVSDETPRPAPAPSGASPVTGALSETDFKKLHELRGESAPPRAGRDVQLADGNRAYLSVPANATAPLPGLVVIHEWWGLNEHVMHWADRLAAEGYAALAVDLYGGEVASTPDRAMQLVKSVDDASARATLLAGHRFLASDPRVRAKRRGSIGWCFGGKQSLNLALAAPDLDAAVIYYGHVPTDPAVLAPLRAPVLAIFGQRDASIPVETVSAFEAALAKLKLPHRVLTYDAEHAFANPSGARYDARAAEAAWAETRAFLAERLKR